MTYAIHITKTAEMDLVSAANYIEFVLKNPSAADNLLNLAYDKIQILSENPFIHHIVDNPVLASWGIRFVSVNNYLAFYTIDEKSQTVYIVRFLYGKRNWITILHNNFYIG